MGIDRLLRFLPSVRRRQEEKDRATRETATTDRRELAADELIEDANKLAKRLEKHRDENHFAQRIRAQYRGEHG